MGGGAIACLNARDRNTLGFRRDLLTAAAYGVREFLFVYGDRPESGRRSDDLTVRTMIEQARLFAAEHYAGTDSIRIGVSSSLGPVPAWKSEADFLFAQVGFSWEQLLHWREAVTFDGPVYRRGDGGGQRGDGSQAQRRHPATRHPGVAAGQARRRSFRWR